jgi:hypothetical protein
MDTKHILKIVGITVIIAVIILITLVNNHKILELDDKYGFSCNTRLSFELEQNFTKTELLPNQEIEIQSFTITNNEQESVWVCVEDTSCDVDIHEDTLSVEGIVDVEYNNNLIYSSYDSNNELSLETNGKVYFDNTLPTEEVYGELFVNCYEISPTGVFYLMWFA